MRKNRKILSSILILILVRPQVFGREAGYVCRVNNTRPITYDKFSANRNVKPNAEIKNQNDNPKPTTNIGQNTLDNRINNGTGAATQDSITLLLGGIGIISLFTIAGIGAIYLVNQNDKEKEKYADDKRLAPYFKQSRLDTTDKETLDYLFEEMKNSEETLGEHTEDFVLPYTLYRIFSLSTIFDFVDSDSDGNSKPKQFKLNVMCSPEKNGNKQHVTSVFSISSMNHNAIDDSFNKAEIHEKYNDVYYSCIKNELKPDNWENLCHNVYTNLSVKFCNEKILKLLKLIGHIEFTFKHTKNENLLECKIADSSLVNQHKFVIHS